MQRHLYPNDWPEISYRIRQRDGHCCKFCGAHNYMPHPITGSRVVLTVSHLDHDTTNNSDDNLAALCQRCHLQHDVEHHRRNAARTRRQRKLDSGQIEMTEKFAQ